VEEGFVKTKGLVLLTVVSASLLAAHAFAGDYRAPRLPDGTPDLQNVWTNATATPMERSPELGERRCVHAEGSCCDQQSCSRGSRSGAAPSDPNKRKSKRSRSLGRQLQPVLDRPRHVGREINGSGGPR
jgi:hypothetical protein